MSKVSTFFGKLAAFLTQIFTDAAGRPEIKMILGVLIIVVAVVDLLARDSLGRFGALSGLGLTLVGVTAAADAAYDKASLASGAGLMGMPKAGR